MRMMPINRIRTVSPSSADRLPVFVETRAQCARRGMARAVAGRDGDVDRRQGMLIQAKRLARDALDAIARDGAAESACRDRKT